MSSAQPAAVTARLLPAAVLLSLLLFGLAVTSAFRPAGPPPNRVAVAVREQFTGDVARLLTQSAALVRGLEELKGGMQAPDAPYKTGEQR